MINCKNGLFLVPRECESLLSKVCKLNLDCFEISEMPVVPSDLSNAGVVLMTMNQTSSYFQYSHEILSFLLSGVNVCAYDNFGKGLSHGMNSESGLYLSLNAAYRYLIDSRGFSDHQILLKGQCAGGPLSSVLAARHPNVHVWIDQAPVGYAEMVDLLFDSYLAEGIN